VFVLPDWLENGLKNIRKARAILGAPSEVQAAADRPLPVLDRLIRSLKGLETYCQSRGQVADNVTRGRREHGQVPADLQAVIAANEALSAAIDREQDRGAEREIAGLEASGDMIGYDSALALHRVKALLALFGSAQDACDPARLARGDALVAEIVAALADGRQRLAAADGSDDRENGPRNSMFDSAARHLDGMVGAYRDLRRTGNPVFYNAVVSGYNEAVDRSNMGTP